MQNIQLIIEVEKPYLSVKEYAEKCGISESRVRNFIRNNNIKIFPRESEKSNIYINMLSLVERAIAESNIALLKNVSIRTVMKSE